MIPDAAGWDERWLVEFRRKGVIAETENVLTDLLDQLSWDAGEWQLDDQGNVFVSYNNREFGMKRLAARLGMRSDGHLRALLRESYKAYDPGLHAIITKDENGTPSARLEDLFCARIRRMRYVRSMRSRNRCEKLRG